VEDSEVDSNAEVEVDVPTWPAMSASGGKSTSPFPKHDEHTAEEYPFDSASKDPLAPALEEPQTHDIPMSYQDKTAKDLPTLSRRLSSDESIPLVLGPLDPEEDSVSPAAAGPTIGETDRNLDIAESSQYPAEHAEDFDGGDNCLADFIAFRDIMGATVRRGSTDVISVGSSGKRSRTTVIGSAGGIDEEDGKLPRPAKTAQAHHCLPGRYDARGLGTTAHHLCTYQAVILDV
jgi:hypothetical protein